MAVGAQSGVSPCPYQDEVLRKTRKSGRSNLPQKHGIIEQEQYGIAAHHYRLNGCRKDERFGGGVRYFDAASGCTCCERCDALGMAYLHDKAMYCNLRSICTNYAALGVTRFLLSRAVESRSELEIVRDSVSVIVK